MDNVVIVVNTDNYKSSYSEKPPFKARILYEYDVNIVVKSLTTNKEYELYSHQILERMEISEIRKLINLENYGK